MGYFGIFLIQHILNCFIFTHVFEYFFFIGALSTIFFFYLPSKLRPNWLEGKKEQKKYCWRECFLNVSPFCPPCSCWIKCKNVRWWLHEFIKCNLLFSLPEKLSMVLSFLLYNSSTSTAPHAMLRSQWNIFERAMVVGSALSDFHQNLLSSTFFQNNLVLSTMFQSCASYHVKASY